MNLLKTFLFLSTLIITPSLMAADSSSGCGLGWAVTQRTSLLASSIRSTTNGLSGNNTFGMTSGTSGCAKHSIVKTDKMDTHLIESNYDAIIQEMAMGKGANLTALVRTLGCADSYQTQVKSKLKNNYVEIVGDMDSPSVLTQKVRDQVYNDSVLSQGCSLI